MLGRICKFMCRGLAFGGACIQDFTVDLKSKINLEN